VKHAFKIVLLLTTTLPAYAEEAATEATADAGPVIADLIVWALLLLILAGLVLSWHKIIRWVDLFVLPVLARVDQAVPDAPRLRRFIAHEVETNVTLFDGCQLGKGELITISTTDTSALPSIVSSVLTHPSSIVALPSRQASTKDFAAIAGQLGTERLFLMDGQPDGAILAALSLQGSPVVILMDTALKANSAALFGTWQAIGIVVLPPEEIHLGPPNVREYPGVSAMETG